MRVSTSKPFWATLSLLLVPHSQAQSCYSFGIDFQDGNSYFQNSLSSDFFTFVSEFEGGSLQDRLIQGLNHQYRVRKWYCSESIDSSSRVSGVRMHQHNASAGRYRTTLNLVRAYIPWAGTEWLDWLGPLSRLVSVGAPGDVPVTLAWN